MLVTSSCLGQDFSLEPVRVAFPAWSFPWCSCHGYQGRVPLMGKYWAHWAVFSKLVDHSSQEWPGIWLSEVRQGGSRPVSETIIQTLLFRGTWVDLPWRPQLVVHTFFFFFLKCPWLESFWALGMHALIPSMKSITFFPFHSWGLSYREVE